jgi:PAS domain S-box-containing protein
MMMSTKQRKRVSWIFIIGMLAIAGIVGTLITQAQRDYQEAHKRALMWRNVIDGVPGGIVVCDPDGAVVAWNAGATALFGWEEDEVIGANITFLMPNGDARDRHSAAIVDKDAVERLQDGGVSRFSCYAITKCGHVKHVRIRVTGIHNGYKYFLAYIDLEENLGPVVVAAEPDIIEPAPIQQQLRKQF